MWYLFVFALDFQSFICFLTAAERKIVSVDSEDAEEPSSSTVNTSWLWQMDGSEQKCQVKEDVVCQLAAPYSTWIGSHNITMTWESLNQSDVVYILQWTGPSLSGIWAQAENVTESTYTVKQLDPFTCYKFRVWAMIAEIHACSPSSPCYQTKPFGLPSSPSIESIESVSGESVEVRWSLPKKPGGPILGFNLNLTSNEHIISVTTGGNVFFNTFYPTFHNTTYRISIAAVNQEGQGSVAEGSITTPAQVEQNGGRWVFASRWNSLRMREEDADFFTTALCLSDSLIESNITGVAVHYSSSHVYFSEGTRIWSKGAGNLTDHSDLKLLHSAPLEVTALSVDWLYQRIYYVSSGKVYYCGLDDCSFPVDMNLNLSSDAVNIIADPYNGWLFLLLSSGIYRCPLPDASDQQHEMSHIVKTHSVSNFVVSFLNKRLVYHDKSDQTLNATSMDGLFPVTLYTNVNFEANSIVYEDDFFMLTNGYALYKQVGQSQVATFNEFTMDCDIIHSQNDGFDNICAFSASAQPYPVPRRPRHLQVLFGSDKANVYWDKPENMIEASPSAWQNWTYAINCSMNDLAVMSFSGITGTSVTVPDLQSSQQYNVTVWACSPAGCSRSVSYEGTTLQPADEPPYIAAASDDEIWKQDLDSIEFMEKIVSHIGDVQDMDWCGSTIYWTNTSGHINWIELGNQSLSVMTMPSPMNAEALAFDWLGQYLYWSCNSNQICRGSTSDHGVEIFLQAEQKILSLVIDSLNAAIYWTTETSVEVCRLDGEDYQLLDKLSVFSGKEVAGITLNVIEGNLYWLVQDGSLLNLYRVNISPHGRQKSKAVEFARWTTSQISYHQVGSYSGRIVWLDENKQLRIQELNQNNSVLMSSKTLTAFSVVQQMLKPLPVWYRRHKKKIHGTVTQTGVDFHPDVELEYIRGLVGLGNACFAISQFNHPNILRLLGVCLLNEPHYLILELMEGGDLRSYLRGARPTNTRKELLNLTSLLDISLDAATGCAYLERMHFVHRDIAARNCLVSFRSFTDPERIVKIGDFGLARDVYKNDYYRKKGEGLLPVRWMSPESLTDGIFNKYSDVWAFGVLLWEIMTLGKLPYPTYTNHEVLSHINTGGRLPSPAGCPQRLYNLMMSCWSKEPTERPNFQCLEETLSKLRDYEADKRANQNGAEGHVNQAYQEDEEEVCTGVDEDEVLETGLSPMLSNEGLNYLMYRAESPDSVRTDSSTPTEDR
ncbi:Proto-oncogene tyrosine-protein kinase ROS [Anabarilius grahami]|uniref:receptor protein-tyrosine kinase n=1 Tax=Anabarilius grahami TaxID=495550 RepID=A0A3N0XXE9_ANAGA|nr:Proto-oncogene tyrosine-protein kinase ROS [Anabarilius grahami]